jgi:hypothetical protein
MMTHWNTHKARPITEQRKALEQQAATAVELRVTGDLTPASDTLPEEAMRLGQAPPACCTPMTAKPFILWPSGCPTKSWAGKK